MQNYALFASITCKIFSSNKKIRYKKKILSNPQKDLKCVKLPFNDPIRRRYVYYFQKKIPLMFNV